MVPRYGAFAVERTPAGPGAPRCAPGRNSAPAAPGNRRSPAMGRLSTYVETAPVSPHARGIDAPRVHSVVRLRGYAVVESGYRQVQRLYVFDAPQLDLGRPFMAEMESGVSISIVSRYVAVTTISSTIISSSSAASASSSSGLCRRRQAERHADRGQCRNPKPSPAHGIGSHSFPLIRL